MSSYIVRIYRENPDKARSIIGIVEEVGAAGKRAFTNIDELWEILNPLKIGRRKRSAGQPRKTILK